MDSTNFVPPAIGIPAGPVTPSNPSSQEGGKRKPVAAIIRPIPREYGRKGSLRLDPAKPGAGKAHLRTNQLDDYVKWLRNKISFDREARKQAALLRLASQTAKSDASIASAIGSAASLLTEAKSAPQAAPIDVVPVVTTQQVNAPQESTESVIAADESLASDSFFSTITTASEMTSQPHEMEGMQTVSTSKNTHQRIDPPVRQNGLPAAHLGFSESSITEPGSLETSSPETKKLTAEDTEEFISMVSKAIASVLTDAPEPAFEEKVRSHFETELHTRAIQTIASLSNESVDQMDRAVLADLADVAGKTVVSMEPKAEQVAEEVLYGSLEEIPTSVAAWDVEDFRWPLVTNQMIVSGGEAIDQLSQSAFELTSPSNQRLAVAGLGRGEGTTSIAISLARWAAACGKNVLLVDADLVTPGLSTQVGLAPNLSWINAISQSLPPAEVIVRSQKSNLCVMPLAQMVSRVTWPRFVYDNLGELISPIQHHFDLIILDVGPASQMLAELSKPGLLVDATLLVHNGVNSPEFKKTKSQIEGFGISKFIVAQNRAQRKSNVA